MAKRGNGSAANWYRLVFRKSGRCLPLFILLATFLSQAKASPAIQLQFVSRGVIAGESGDLLIRFKISSGFKIPKRPSPKLQLNSSTDLEVRGDMSLFEEGTGKDPEYFDAFRPLSLQLVSSRNARRGQYLLQGRFTYFYCSEKDKYCSRSVENLRIPIDVTDHK